MSSSGRGPVGLRALRVARSPSVQTTLLTVALAACSGIALVVLRAQGGVEPAPPFRLAWWAIAVAFIAAELNVFHLELNRETHTFTLSEVPLTVAFFFATPLAALTGRLVSQTIVIFGKERQAFRKAAFNIASATAETSAALIVFSLLHDRAGPTSPRAWLTAALAVAAGAALSLCSVLLVIAIHGAHTRRREAVATAAVSSTTNVALGLTACVLLWTATSSIALLLLLVAVFILGYRAYARLSQRYANLQLVYQFARSVSAPVSSDAFNEILTETSRVLRAEVVELAMYDGSESSMRVRSVLDVGTTPTEGDLRQHAPVWNAVFRDGDTVVIARDERQADRAAYLAQLGLRDAILTPLRRDNATYGVMLVGNRLGEVSTFDDQDARVFETLASQANIAMQSGELIEQLADESAKRVYESMHDALTGLPNRTLFQHRVRDLERSSTSAPHVVMLVDVDQFKEVNDTLGHDSGDILLCEVAKRLRAVLAPAAVVARLGGDEFGVLAPIVGSGDALSAARSLQHEFETPIDVNGFMVRTAVSVGLAIFPTHGRESVTLLRRADVAMHSAKARGTGAEEYDSSIDVSSRRRLSLAAELREAIEQRQLVVYYQPKIAIATLDVVGCEALVRWEHPEHGFLPPDEFIGIAEHTGLITPLTRYVLADALEECRRWTAAGMAIDVSVNVAVRSLLEPQFVTMVANVVSRSAVAAHRLTLEITESGIMSDSVRAIAVLGDLTRLGMKLSIDDFGTGYSSLAYLQKLPVQEVKIDKSFVLDIPENAANVSIVRSIVNLGHSLGLAVVAEGVETEAALSTLRDADCDIAQGYFFSRPLSAEAFANWLAADRMGRLGGSSHHLPGS